MFSPLFFLPFQLHCLDGLFSVASDHHQSPIISLRLRIRARRRRSWPHSRAGLMLSPSSLAVSLLLCLFCGFFPVGSAQAAGGGPVPSPSPSRSPSFSPTPSPAAETPSPASEISSLLSLKASWEDPFNNLASWNLSSNPLYCSWAGVTCRENTSTIIFLSLSDLSLSGPLPPSIANLSSLRTLDLAFNNFHGSIPPELGSLSSLKRLQLRQNLFNGSIPERLFNATSLQFVLLEKNSLTGNISPSISNLVNLVYFSVAYNALQGSIPASITNLTKLSALYAGHNNLSGDIPTRIRDLRALIHLDLQDNLFTGDIPSSIGSLTFLQELDLSNNELTGTLSVELGGLENVTLLDLSSNHFHGSIPAEIGKLSALQTLDLHQNNLSGTISPALGYLIRLERLNLSYNNLSGEVPTNGVLANFSASSFEGNALLCGGPLENIRCVSSTPPSPTPPPPLSAQPSMQKSSGFSRKGKIVTGIVGGAFALCSLILCFVFLGWRRRLRETVQIQSRLSPDLSDNVNTSKMEMYSRGFKLSYEEIVSHAGYYDTAHVVGKGRFATVFRSDLPGGTRMAVKLFKNPIPQAAFEKEVEGLESASRFSTLLPIRGYFASAGEKAIFYDFMQNGSLYDLLHNNSDASAQLDWSMRLTIAMGIAQALTHLHKGTSIRVLHKDLKSTNVFLDESMYPLVADYGLIGLVSKSVVETPGYMPPELKTTKKYTEKTDVYSFGVVLLELLTGKKPVSYIGDRQLNLVTWALRLQRDGRGREVFSTNLVESCPYPDYPDRALNLAVFCLNDQPAQRPTMSEIASILEGLGGNNSPMRSPGVQQDKPLLM